MTYEQERALEVLSSESLLDQDPLEVLIYLEELLEDPQEEVEPCLER